MFRKQTAMVILVAVALIGVGLSLLVSSKWGIGMSPDSGAYVAAARNLLAGNGLSILSNDGLVPMTHFPPLFPMILSGVSLLGIDPVIAARWTIAFLFGVNILLIGIIVKLYTKSLWMSLSGAVLMLTSETMLNIHTMAWSEAPFIFLGFLGLLLLAAQLENPRLSLLISSSGAMALAFLTRYAGLPFVIAGAIGILLFSCAKYQKRIVHCLIFGTLSCLPMALWITRNFFFANIQRVVPKGTNLHPAISEHVTAALNTVSSWVLSWRVPSTLRILALAVVLLVFFILLVAVKKKEAMVKVKDGAKQYLTKLPALLTTYIVSYVIFLIITIFCFEPYLDMRRTLVPVYISTVILVLIFVNRILKAWGRNRSVKAGLFLIGIAFVGFYSLRAVNSLSPRYYDGVGYASRQWVQSELIREIKSLRRETPIYTNAVYAIYILTGRPVSSIPDRINGPGGVVNHGYVVQLTSMRKRLSSQDGVLAYFTSETPSNFPTEEELKKALPLVLIKKCEDGSVYKIRN
jgi:hypothetical protein